ncbi:Coiled-coil domain-containing protein [Ooceraea biroi]|uniref:Coiled-coil domain-containing protein n=1 Tax=Ooceraea biroi TaxID=2015173 RepID=A0A026X1R5_OOCBI|nr:Coiled-coil domain-containing protein [Ooceraea biroi]
MQSDIMEDLKFKFFDLINKQNTAKVPLMGLDPELLNPSELQKCEDIRSEAEQSTESELIPDQDVLESIEDIYFTTDGNFDPSRYELEKLPILHSKQIQKCHKKLEQQSQVVSKKLLQLILDKQKACEVEFGKILLLQEQLQDILEICRIGRTDLKLAKTQFTTASLGILANYQKRQIVEELLSNLKTIKTLQRTGDRLQELLNEGNYPGAISLLLECQSAAQTYKHFHCIAALNGKLQDILVQAEEALDNTLSKMCTQFDVTVYSSIQEAYTLLGKTQSAMDQLHMHFTVAIHNTAFTAIHSYAGGDMKREYKQLCQAVPREKCVACLIELCRSLWTILSSYYLVVNWHNVQNDQQPEPERSDVKDLEANLSKQYIKRKLENSMGRVWHDVEMKISIYLTNADLTYTKFEQFVQVLGIVNRLMEIGEELCNFKSKDLQESIRKQSLSYFSHYHTSRLDELRIFLENDGWELCPVKSNFVATQLLEFRSLKPSLSNCKAWSSLDSSNLSDSDNSTGIDLQKYLEGGSSLFTIGLDDSVDEDILINNDLDQPAYFSDESDDDIPDELKHEYVDESDHTKASKKKCKLKQSGPMVTNTTLSVLRVCGKYLQMSKLLRSIAVTVIQSMIQFFELCFYTVHLFFTSDLQINSDSLYSPKLKLSLTRIRENLIILENDANEESASYNKIKQPQLSSIVNLSQPEKLYGLTERIVAVESLIFLGQQYESLKPYLEHLIANSPQRGFLHQFYMQTIASTADLRKPVYMAVASQAFDIASILNLMNKVNWEVTDVMSQHSNYIDALIQEVCTLSERLNTIGTYIPLNTDVCNAVWENVAHLITHTLVEGFSSAKKCSNGGRALMQLDFTQLQSKFEKLTSLRPMPHREYVELYIKAYYLPENSFEEWIKEHKEYSVKHLIGLISATCQNNKKTRQRLIALVEEQRSSR